MDADFFRPGDRVTHIALKVTATVLRYESVGGTLYYIVQKDEPLGPGLTNGPSNWAAYHVRAGV